MKLIRLVENHVEFELSGYDVSVNNVFRITPVGPIYYRLIAWTLRKSCLSITIYAVIYAEYENG